MEKFAVEGRGVEFGKLGHGENLRSSFPSTVLG
jgi:hypothetical protein